MYKTDAPVNGLVQVLMTEIDIIDVQMKIGYTLLLFYKNNNNNNTSGCIFFTHIFCNGDHVMMGLMMYRHSLLQGFHFYLSVYLSSFKL